MIRKLMAVSALVLLISAFCWAQTGTVTGIVTDEDGLAVAGARVMLRSTTGGGGCGGSSVFTGEDGSYTIEEVDPGSYKVRAMKHGVGRGISDEFEVVAGETVTVNVVLTPMGCGGGGGGGGGGMGGGH